MLRLTFCKGQIGVELTPTEEDKLRDHLNSRRVVAPRSAVSEAVIVIENARSKE